MPHPARFLPALLGLALIALIFAGSGGPADNLCRFAVPQVLREDCQGLPHLAIVAGALAFLLVAFTLLLIWRWQQAHPRAISYESDAGRWVMLGWVLAIGGAVLLFLGLMLIGSGGWPLSRQSRHVAIQTGQLPLQISTVQRRYFASYPGAAGEALAVCASFGEVTMRNRSHVRSLALDLRLAATPRLGGEAAPARLPTRADLAAIARRGLAPQALFANPVELAPRQTLQRELVFVIPFARTALPDPDRDYAFALEVSDRLTGETVAMTLPAEYRG